MTLAADHRGISGRIPGIVAGAPRRNDIVLLVYALGITTALGLAAWVL